ncbi:MAG: DUF6807 family protein [Armatimonadota bacterium]
MNQRAMVSRSVAAVGLLVAASPWALCGGPPGDAPGIELKHDYEAGRMEILAGGQLAVVYRYGDGVDLPHYLIHSPSGKLMTVEHPNPYPHHRSVWFGDKVRLDGQRAVSTYNALTSRIDKDDPTSPFRDYVRHDEFAAERVNGTSATTGAHLVWLMDQDKPVLDETRSMRIVALGGGEYLLDITFTVTASHGDVAFVSDATHYAWPYVRMAPAFSVDSGGRMVNSEGGVNQKGTHGQVATWVDYSNTVEGTTEGLAVFSHTDNGHPHRWLTRDYGTFGPRRVDARSGKEFTLKRGESLTQRVGILVHRGDVEAGKVAERYEQYVKGEFVNE